MWQKIKDNIFISIIWIVVILFGLGTLIAWISSLYGCVSNMYHAEYIDQSKYVLDKDDFIWIYELENYDETTKEVAYQSYINGAKWGMEYTVDSINGVYD